MRSLCLNATTGKGHQADSSMRRSSSIAQGSLGASGAHQEIDRAAPTMVSGTSGSLPYAVRHTVKQHPFRLSICLHSMHDDAAATVAHDSF